MHITPTFLHDEFSRRALSPDQRRALELVGRYDGRFGRARLARVLAGEPEPPAVEYGLKYERLRGSVASLARALAALDALCEQGLIEVDATRGRFLVLRLTRSGARRLGKSVAPPRRVRRLEAAEQARFDRLVARRDALARESGALPSSLARLSELREAARALVCDRVGLARVLSADSFLRFGEAAHAVLAEGGAC